MGAEGTVWKILGIVATLLTAVIPAYVAYDLYDPPPDPEKRVELSSLSPIDPLKALSGIRDKATISVSVGDEVFDNLVIVQAFLINKGTQPILPTDYHKTLTVSVEEPWKIVTVENQGIYGTPGIPLDWHRVSDTQFEAAPALLNARDRVTVAVYVTNTEPSDPSDRATNPTVKWDARITNLSQLSTPRSTVEEYYPELEQFPYINVFLAGWAVPFTVVVALIFQALYLHLFVQSGLLQQWSWRWVAVLAGPSLMSFAAAESMATYIVGGPLARIFGLHHWLNLPPIVINAILLGLLWWNAWRRTEKAPLRAG